MIPSVGLLSSQGTMGLRDKCFLRRVRDGKYYRGAKFWRHCSSWRSGSLQSVQSWLFMFNFYQSYLRETLDEYEFVFLNSLE